MLSFCDSTATTFTACADADESAAESQLGWDGWRNSPEVGLIQYKE